MQNHKKPEELKREEQLFNYLSKSYIDHQKGQSAPINKIIEEVCRKNKDVHQIQLWMDLFMRLLLQLQKTGADSKLIIDIVLIKMPWFTSDHHFQAINKYKHSIFTILSHSPNLITTIYRLLLQQLQLSIDQSREDICCQLQGQDFKDKNQLHQHINNIANRYNIDKEDQILRLTEEDRSFMKELFAYHPDSSQKLKGMIDIGYGYYPSKNRSKCFYIIKRGEYEDISYIKSIEGFYDELYRDSYFKLRDSKYSEFAIQMIQEIDQIYKVNQQSKQQLNRQKLLDIIQDIFPHKNMNDMYWKIFIINTLKLGERIPEIAAKIFKIIYVKTLSIDSEIKFDPQFNNFIIKTRMPYLNSFQQDEMCKKLDHILFFLFDFLESKLNRNTNQKSYFIKESNVKYEFIFQQEDLINQIFKELQRVFQDVILKNQNYRMAHYIYFYFCSLDGQYRTFKQHFISQLLLNVQSTTQAKYEKINSIYYLSSLLVRCKQIEQPIFIKSIQILIEFLAKNNKDLEFDCYLVQMLTYLISTKSSQLETIKQEIHQILLDCHQKYKALQYIHYDILVKFNDVLLKTKSDNLVEKLIEITASLITKLVEKRCQGDLITNNHSPNTPQLLFMDHESHYSKQSAWTRDLNKQTSQLEFYQPFNTMTLLYSEGFIKQNYKYDSELVKDEGGSLNNSNYIESSPVKKIRRRTVEPIAGDTPQKKVKQ